MSKLNNQPLGPILPSNITALYHPSAASVFGRTRDIDIATKLLLSYVASKGS